MSYTDELECPHCHKAIGLEVEIEGEDTRYMSLCPMVIPKPTTKGVIDCPIDKEETLFDRLELERRLGK